MSRRHFVETPVREDGQPVPRYRLVCGSCGCGETLGRQNFGPEIADTQVPKKFEERGWSVGKRRDGRDDRCPSCVNRDQEARRRRLHVVQCEECVPVPQTAPGFAVVAPAKQQATLAEKPREMTRDERRLIWAKLDEVYVDEKVGYSAGWTDARLAQDLGIPRAWVSMIREENFGPGVSEEVQAFLKEAARLQQIKESLCQEQDELRGRIGTWAKEVDAFQRLAKRIETAVR